MTTQPDLGKPTHPLRVSERRYGGCPVVSRDRAVASGTVTESESLKHRHHRRRRALLTQPSTILLYIYTCCSEIKKKQKEQEFAIRHLLTSTW